MLLYIHSFYIHIHVYVHVVGITYIPVIEEDRAATMSRIETRKNKKGLQMNVLPASSEEMLEGM